MSARWIAPLLSIVAFSHLPAEDVAFSVESLIAGSPAEFEQRLRSDPNFAQRVVPELSQALTKQSSDKNRLLLFLASASKARTLRISRQKGPWGDSEINEILTLAFVDPNRFFGHDPVFQALILSHLPTAIDGKAPDTLRRRLLNTLSQIPAIGFDQLETIALGWDLANRPSSERELPFQDLGPLSCPDGVSPLQALLFSFPSSMFDTDDCIALLDSVHQSSPSVTLAVISDYTANDGASAERFRAKARALGAHLIAPLGPSPSPWLRDPIFVGRDSNQQLVLINRAGSQQGREQDQNIPRQLIQGAPSEFESLTGPLFWSQAPFHFHGGHLLFTPESPWISVHSIETQILQRLDLQSIDVQKLIDTSGWKSFSEAANASAEELGKLGGHRVQWVHPWPSPPAGMEHSDFVRCLGGGNDIDLDTLLTILPGGPSDTAILGDLESGAALLGTVSDEELAEFSRRFQIRVPTRDLRDALTRWKGSPRVTGLSAFLELVATHLRAKGLRVRRTPLLMMPTPLIANHPKFAAEQPHAHFPIGFSNVVLDSQPAPNEPAEFRLRAHSFESCLPTFDEEARRIFTEAGCELMLHPALVESIISEGGFRCATQEIRKPLNPANP